MNNVDDKSDVTAFTIVIVEVLGSIVLGIILGAISFRFFYPEGAPLFGTVVCAVIGGAFGFFTSSRIVCTVMGFVVGLLLALALNKGVGATVLYAFLGIIGGWVSGRMASALLLFIGGIIGLIISAIKK